MKDAVEEWIKFIVSKPEELFFTLTQLSKYLYPHFHLFIKPLEVPTNSKYLFCPFYSFFLSIDKKRHLLVVPVRMAVY